MRLEEREELNNTGRHGVSWREPREVLLSETFPATRLRQRNEPMNQQKRCVYRMSSCLNTHLLPIASFPAGIVGQHRKDGEKHEAPGFGLPKLGIPQFSPPPANSSAAPFYLHPLPRIPRMVAEYRVEGPYERGRHSYSNAFSDLHPTPKRTRVPTDNIPFRSQTVLSGIPDISVAQQTNSGV